MFIRTERPTVKIYFLEGPRSATALRQIGYGIEEEGVLLDIEPQTDPKSADEMGWNAAKASQVEVGIGIDTKYIVLHYAKLEMTKPLFKIPIGSGDDKIRIIGTNAGRLVKKLPLKITEADN